MKLRSGVAAAGMLLVLALGWGWWDEPLPQAPYWSARGAVWSAGRVVPGWWVEDPEQPHYREVYESPYHDQSHCVDVHDLVPPVQPWTEAAFYGTGCWHDGGRDVTVYSLLFSRPSGSGDQQTVRLGAPWTITAAMTTTDADVEFVDAAWRPR
jgi:hypothetical protein